MIVGLFQCSILSCKRAQTLLEWLYEPHRVSQGHYIAQIDTQLADIIHQDNETAEFDDWKCYIYCRRYNNVIIAIQRNKENKRKYY